MMDLILYGCIVGALVIVAYITLQAVSMVLYWRGEKDKKENERYIR